MSTEGLRCRSLRVTRARGEGASALLWPPGPSPPAPRRCLAHVPPLRTDPVSPLPWHSPEPQLQAQRNDRAPIPLTALRGKADGDRTLTSPYSRRPSAFLSDRPKSSVLGVLTLLSPALRWFCYKKNSLGRLDITPQSLKARDRLSFTPTPTCRSKSQARGWLSLD